MKIASLSDGDAPRSVGEGKDPSFTLTRERSCDPMVAAFHLTGHLVFAIIAVRPAFKRSEPPPV